MQGRILDAAVTGNQGLILGDDGTNYTFGPADWLDGSARAQAGMIVEFNPQGSEATDVPVIQGAPQPAPVPPPPVQAPAYQAPPQAPAQPAPPQVSQASYPPRASQPPHQRPAFTVPSTPDTARPRANFVPRFPKAEESKSTVALLLIFLGPLGIWISIFYMKSRPEEWIPILVITVPITAYLLISNSWFLLAVVYISLLIVGILLLMMSQERWNRNRHFSRDHTHNFLGAPRKEPEHCRTGICRAGGP